MGKNKMNIFWFRRDLRLDDNTGLNLALKNGLTQVIFIFDDEITSNFPKDDARINFIYDSLEKINQELITFGSSLKIYQGKVDEIFKQLILDFTVENVFCNEDYEPYAQKRDKKVEFFLKSNGIKFISCKDQVIFSPLEVLKADNSPYSIYTPYSKKWKQQLFNNGINFQFQKTENNFATSNFDFQSLTYFGFEPSKIKINPYYIKKDLITNYEIKRNFPAENGTSNIGIYLRFGLISIRKLVNYVHPLSEIFLNELIWREFFMQILYHYPENIKSNFRKNYNGILWLNDEIQFEHWKNGTTGYPIVDAGMRELNQTGRMHNRVRMIVASFLCKHLLIDWLWGEAYFAQKLLDYDLASNNGNWQWASGTGCDASPYFRVFNPMIQTEKFDKDRKYIKKWIPEIDELTYPQPIVNHEFARNRAIETYKKGILNS